MAKKEEPKARGVWEKVSGSNVWWVRYRDAGGKLRREKVGRKSDAIDLFRNSASGLRGDAEESSSRSPCVPWVSSSGRWLTTSRLILGLIIATNGTFSPG